MEEHRLDGVECISLPPSSRRILQRSKRGVFSRLAVDFSLLAAFGAPRGAPGEASEIRQFDPLAHRDQRNGREPRKMPKPCNTAETPVGAPELTCWSTDDVDKTQRIDYYEETVARSMIPVGIRMRCASDFSSSMKMTSVDGFSVLRIKGSPHEVYRAEREIARSGAHKYHLLLTCETPWTLHHQGAVALGAGEAVLLDSQRPQTSTTTVPYEMVHVMLDAAWLDQWVPQPDMLVGRKITAATPWGNSLASFAKVLTPELLLDSPLPARLLSDHLGAMLALACNEMDQKVAPRKSETSQRHRILDMLAQQCTDPQLTAKDVAASLNISVRTLHRALALTKETFGPLLIEARLRIARRMLESRIFMNMTVSEIAKRTGFATSSHFARVFHAVYGMTPSGFRQASLGEIGRKISPPDSSFDSPAVSSPRPVGKRG